MTTPPSFYLSIFPHARRLDELRSKGVGPWPVAKIATITIELEGQEMVFLNGGPGNSFIPPSRSSCTLQEEIDTLLGQVDRRRQGHGWAGSQTASAYAGRLCRDMGELVSHPKAMQAMMGMIKMDLRALEAAAREN